MTNYISRPRNSPEWLELSARVKDEAGRCCQLCGSTEKFLVTHHLDGNPWNATRRNLACVCAACHDKLHSWLVAARKAKANAS